MSAIVQHITYNEYLPLVLGTDLMVKYGLNIHPGHWNGYDVTVRPDAKNGFQTAAFRFGHSLISNSFKLKENSLSDSKYVFLSEGFFRPHELYKAIMGSGVDRILYGMASKPSQSADRHFATQVTRNLFTKSPPHGLGTDLVALNIHRGRDHGLPSYNRYRRWCNLPTGHTFTNLPDINDDIKMKLSHIYDEVEDIDLYVGGLMENHLEGASVGPTFGCIIARQFSNLRKGDRFWYETSKKNLAFTAAQLTEIKKMRLAKILCDVSDNIPYMQPWVLLQTNNGTKHCNNQNNCRYNKLIPCFEFSNLDIKAWKD